MFKEILDWYDRKAGYRRAGYEIRLLKERPRFQENRQERWRSIFVGRRAIFQCAFENGWQNRWVEAGAFDAERGRVWEEMIDYQPYRLGWATVIQERRKLGWRNSRLERVLDKLS